MLLKPSFQAENRSFSRQLSNAKRIIKEAKGVMFGELIEAKRIFDSKSTKPLSSGAENGALSSNSRKKERGIPASSDPSIDSEILKCSESEQIEALKVSMHLVRSESQRKESTIIGEKESARISVETAMEDLIKQLECSVVTLHAANMSVSQRLRAQVITRMCNELEKAASV